MWKTVASLLEARHGQVLGHGEDRDEAVPLTILGNEREAASDATSHAVERVVGHAHS